MLNISTIKQLQKIIAKGLPVKSRAKWLVQFYKDIGIGSIHGGVVSLSIDDIDRLIEYLESQDIPLSFSEEDLSTRSNASKILADEKSSKTSVTSERLLAIMPFRALQIGDVILPSGRIFDLTVTEFLQSNVSTVVVIENFEAFVQSYNLYPLFDNDAIFLFRGMSGSYSSKGVKQVLEEFDGCKVGYFDFDPAGINLLGHNGFDAVILPTFEAVASGKMKSDLNKFTKQTLSPCRYNALSDHYELLVKNRLAISQEYLGATEQPLSLIFFAKVDKF